MTGEWNIENGVLLGYTGKDIMLSVPDGVHEIAPGAFKGMVFLEKLQLPETISVIREDAFKGCKRLRTVNFPASLVLIGSYAFHRCHSLEQVLLPPSVTELGDCVFLYCDSLRRLSIPGVTRLGKQVFLNDIRLSELTVSPELALETICDVFTGCGSIHQIELAGGETFLLNPLFDALLPDNKIPKVIRAIVKDVFRMMEFEGRTILRFLTNLRHVEVPDGIEALGTGCFFDKRGILSVKLPVSLKHIGSKAFRNCIGLEQIEFQNPEIDIQSDAFKNCTTLRTVLLQGTKFEFQGISRINSPAVPENSCLELSDYNNSNDSDAIPELVQTIHRQVLSNFYLCGTTLLSYRGMESRVAVPEGITKIAPRAFAGNEAIDKILLPDTVLEIGEEAFADCLLLQTIHLPQGLQKIGASAFENCVKLIRIALPEGILVIEESVFNRCRSLTEITFGTQLQKIGAMAFYGCRSLKTISFPEHLHSIGSLAFYQCFSLSAIHLPASIQSLGNNIFTASGLRSAVIACSPADYGSDIFSQCQRLKQLTFEQGVFRIGDKIAFGCQSLGQVSLPDTIHTIGKHALGGSLFLKNLGCSGIFGTLLLNGSGYSGTVVLPEGITVIAGGAFYGNETITSIELPNSVTQLGSRAFCGCTALEQIVLSAEIETLEEGVFAYCPALKQVHTTGQIRFIEARAFYGCKNYTGLLADGSTITASAVRIGAEAFWGCEKLSQLDICAEYIGENAFDYTQQWKQWNSATSLISVYRTVIDGCNCAGTVIIPEGTLQIAPYAFCGNINITRLQLPESLQTIGYNAFCGCTSLTEICFPQTCITLESFCFQKCTSLKQITLKTKDLADGAFAYCTSLTDVTLLETVSLGKETFLGCQSLSCCIFPSVQDIGTRCFSGCGCLSVLSLESVRQFGNYAFERCDSLTTATLSWGTEIGDHAFEDCGHLAEIRFLETSVSASSKMPPAVLGCYAFSGCTWLSTVELSGTRYHFTGLWDYSAPELPSFVKELYGSALSCFFIDETNSLCEYYNSGTVLRIPDGICKIEGSVFYNMLRLTEVSVPESVKYIGPRAFSGTAWMAAQQKKSPFVIINQMLLDASGSQTIVELPETLTLVSGWAFANCFALTGLVLNSHKTHLEEFTFRNCIHLEQVTDLADGKRYELKKLSDLNADLPSWVRRIFQDCYNCFKLGENGVLAECTGNIKDLSLPEGIQVIGTGVFQDSNLLTQIKLSKDCFCIEPLAFQGCKWLTSVSETTHLKFIGKRAFSGCIRLEEIEPCERLEEIQAGAFEHCTALKRFVVPEGITCLPDRVFYRCHNLEEISLPSTLREIGSETFAFCYSLKSIVFPPELTLVGNRAFAWCKQLSGELLPELIRRTL